MPTIGNLALTLVDWAKRVDPDGKTIGPIAELLNQSNGLDAQLWQQGNLPTGHRVVQRTGLPQVGWRQLNQGVPPSKSTTAQIDESVGMLEGWSQIDKKLANIGGNPAMVRLSEDNAFLESMG